MGTVFNIQKYSLHDGPGIRTTVFLKGCPLRCPWCHNPESQNPRPEIMFFASRCAGCGACTKACPTGAAGVFKTTLALRGTICDTAVTEVGPKGSDAPCTACGRCVEACVYGAREMVGRNMTVDEVMSEVLRDRIFYDQSAGGVTFSGGEPLMQPKFLRDLLLRCKEEGLRTTVDTSGFARWEDVEAIAPLVDVFLYDVKLMDDHKHTQHVGVSNKLILDNLRRLTSLPPASPRSPESRAPSAVARIPLIPGINDDAANIQSTGKFLRECGVRQVSVLPYHDLGSEKYRRLGRQYGMDAAAPPTQEVVDSVVAMLSGYGLTVSAGG